MAIAEEIIDQLISVKQIPEAEPTYSDSIKTLYPNNPIALENPRAGYFYFLFLLNSKGQYNPTKIIILNATKDEFAPTNNAIIEIYEAEEKETEGEFEFGAKVSSTTSIMELTEGRLTIDLEEGTRLEKDKKYIIKLQTRYQENIRNVGPGDPDTFTDGYWFNYFFTPENEEIQPNQIKEYRFGNMIWFQDLEIESENDPFVEGEEINFKSSKYGLTTRWGACGIELWGLSWKDDKISYNEIVSLAGKGADEEAIKPQRVLGFLGQARAELVHQIKKDVFTDWDKLTEEGRNLINSITAYLSAIKIVNYEYEGYGSRFEAREVSGYLQEQADRLIELLKDKDTLKFAEDGT
jgi:hypothetical protein